MRSVSKHRSPGLSSLSAFPLISRGLSSPPAPPCSLLPFHSPAPHRAQSCLLPRFRRPVLRLRSHKTSGPVTTHAFLKLSCLPLASLGLPVSPPGSVSSFLLLPRHSYYLPFPPLRDAPVPQASVRHFPLHSEGSHQVISTGSKMSRRAFISMALKCLS